MQSRDDSHIDVIGHKPITNKVVIGDGNGQIKINNQNSSLAFVNSFQAHSNRVMRIKQSPSSIKNSDPFSSSFNLNLPRKKSPSPYIS